ncbi:amidase [Paucibacter sp. Y2R2-4]|uniref:amidase n=1 Tax=Paucibacter sp. Y2R2-4 TaxID=2893553 RepID=UPI0021E4E27B|nr:amidase [Paucibacter sp. Y2R2-4]MCV2349060.1 amidase [Paucibacter sp. Y2R2-4]
MSHDLSSALQQLQDERLSAAAAAQENQRQARSEGCRNAYVREFSESALASAAAIDAIAKIGAPRPRLGGLGISIKDLFDVAGTVSSAGSSVLRQAPPASIDCPAVARLRQAGAVLTGHTNMSEFAFSGVGINPHYGTPLNPVTFALDGQARIPGGSSSGAAVTVATGAAWAALGSDTGGSIRIPAALQGLVGFKNTARLTPTEGCIPLSTTLDTACALTLSVRDAILLHEVLAARQVRISPRPLRAMRLALVKPLFQDGMDDTVSRAFERSLKRLRAAGCSIEDIDLTALNQISELQAQGGFAAAESWAWHRHHLQNPEQAQQYDPRVSVRIRRGETISAADYIDLLNRRRQWIGEMEAALAGFDAVISPTVPIVAPLLAPLLASDEQFFASNALLLRNPSVVNLLDGCAISLPCQEEGELPVGLMLWSTAAQDDLLLSLALQIEPLLNARP